MTNRARVQSDAQQPSLNTRLSATSLKALFTRPIRSQSDPTAPTPSSPPIPTPPCDAVAPPAHRLIIHRSHDPLPRPPIAATNTDKRKSTPNPHRVSLQIDMAGRLSRYDPSIPSPTTDVTLDPTPPAPFIPTIFLGGSTKKRVVITTENGHITVTLAKLVSNKLQPHGKPIFSQPLDVAGYRLITPKPTLISTIKSWFTPKHTRPKPPRISTLTSESDPTPTTSTQSLLRNPIRHIKSLTSLKSSKSSIYNAVPNPTPTPTSSYQTISKKTPFQLITPSSTLTLWAMSPNDFAYLVSELNAEKTLAMAGAEGGEGTRLLRDLRERDEGNLKCLDCGEDLPEWAVVEKWGDGWKGGIVCSACSGYHRSRDSSKVIVKSFLLDCKAFAETDTELYRTMAETSNSRRLAERDTAAASANVSAADLARSAD